MDGLVLLGSFFVLMMLGDDRAVAATHVMGEAGAPRQTPRRN